MRYYKLILILLTVNLLSCEKATDKLFWISETTPERNDFLFLTESTNVERLKDDSLKLFLSNDEFVQFDSASISYKNFGQIYKTDKFRVFVLLRSNETGRRNYLFLLRTFSNDWKIIDDFELGILDEMRKKYCFGSINTDLIVERKCEDKETSDIMQITEEGKIIMTPFHKQ